MINKELLQKLSCVKCRKDALCEKGGILTCSSCGQAVKIDNGIPDFISSFLVGEVEWRNGGYTPVGYEANIASMPAYRLSRIDKPLLEYVLGDTLEIGCGTCRLAPLVEKKGARYFGLDPVMPFLIYGSQTRNLNCLVGGQGERLPFKDKAFDSLISGFYSYRFVDPKPGLAEARRVLKDNAVFAFDLLNYWVLRLKNLNQTVKTGFSRPLLKSQSDLFEFVSRFQIREAAAKAGFGLEKIISSPIVPYFHKLDKHLSNIYLRGISVYLGYDVIIVLRAA